MKRNLIVLAAFAAVGLFAAEPNLLKDSEFKTVSKAWNVSPGVTYKNGIASAPLTIVSKNKKDFHCNFNQEIKQLKPGKYVYTGYYKGVIKNMYIVVRSFDAKNTKKELLQKWFSQKEFVKATDKSGWFKFNYTFTVPAGSVKTVFYIEGWGTAKNQNLEMTNLFLKATK